MKQMATAAAANDPKPDPTQHFSVIVWLTQNSGDHWSGSTSERLD